MITREKRPKRSLVGSVDRSSHRDATTRYNGRMFSARWVPRTILATLAFGGAVLAAPHASALSISASDCNFGFQDNPYNPGDAVCITGELDIIDPGGSPICAAAWVHVIPEGYPDPFFDATTGGENYVQGCAGAGAFFDEIVWLPRLTPGSYEFVVDQYPFGGSLGSEDLRTGAAFSVSNAPIVFSVDVAAIKAAAVDGLAAAEGIKNLTRLLTILDTLSTAADWGAALGPWGAGAGIALGVVCYFTNTDCPTSYNSAVISIGNRILGGIANGMTLHYASIIADPPDPAFDVVVGLDFAEATDAGAPWTPLANQTVPNQQIGVAQLMAVQGAAYKALVPSLEKLQGAQLAGDHAGLLIQAEKVKAYTELAMEAGDAMLLELDVLESHLQSAGTLEAVADVQAELSRIRAEGFNEDEQALMQSFGYDASDMDAARSGLSTTEDPMSIGWQALIDEMRATYTSMQPALTDLAAQVENIRAENEPYALVLRPRASASGPATASVGSAVDLTGAATHDDTNATLTYAWDFDLDGAYDDAAGTTVSFTPVAPGKNLVALRVDDGTADDVAFVTIDVAVANSPPEFVSLSPADTAPFADVGETVVFSVETVDADGDAVDVTWLVDGSEAATGNELSFEMPDEEPHEIRVVAADTDAFSPDAEARFVVRSSKWEGQTGEGGDGTGGDGSGAADGGAASEGAAGDASGCGCSAVGVPSRGLGLATVLAWAAAFLRRRRRTSRPRAHRR